MWTSNQFLVITDRQQFGAKSVIAHAQQYKDLAAGHPYNFEPPQTWFVICNDVPSNVGKMLEAIGVRALSMEDLPASQLSRTVPQNRVVGQERCHGSACTEVNSG